MTTIDPMVQEPPLTEGSPRPRVPRLLVVLTVLVVLVGGGYLVAQRYTSHLFALAPGTAPPVQGYITIKAPGQVHRHKGQILLVTVSLQTVEPLDYVRDKLNHDIQIVNQSALVGTSKPSQLNQASQVQMQQSTQTAVIVALSRLGYKINLQGLGAEVDEVVANTPADGHLAPGDAITAVDSTPTPTSEALVAATRAHRPGDVVRLTVQSSKGTRTETVKLALAPASQGPAHAFMGIATSTQYKPVQLPFPVTIDPGNIGGPSAGLAFTLGIIDELGAGDLTGGRLIAATGTIEPDGSVGDVGGVTQKTAAVRHAGAVAFLVPPGEYNDAIKRAGPHLKVIKVTSLADALNALRSLGGDLSGIGSPPAAAA